MREYFSADFMGRQAFIEEPWQRALREETAKNGSPLFAAHDSTPLKRGVNENSFISVNRGQEARVSLRLRFWVSQFSPTKDQHHRDPRIARQVQYHTELRRTVSNRAPIPDGGRRLKCAAKTRIDLQCKLEGTLPFWPGYWLSCHAPPFFDLR